MRRTGDGFHPGLFRIKVEPYWNVKEVAFVHALDTEAIKVEPYWNVKDTETSKNILGESN